MRGFAAVLGAWSALLGLAVARSRRRAGSLLAVAAGAAIAAAVVLAAAPLMLVARQAAMEDALRAAAPSERSLQLTVQRAGAHDGGADQFAMLDAEARHGLRGDGLAPGTARAVRFSGRSIGRVGSVVLTGVERLTSRVQLSSGRLPRSCTARVCEVVAVTGARVPDQLRLRGAALRVVGRGRLDAVPLGPLPPARGLLDSDATFVVADGVAPLLALKALDRMPRAFAYTRVIDPRAVHPWNASRVLDGLAGAQERFVDTRGAQVTLSAAPVRAEAARGRAAAAFALIIAGLAATVLLAFAAFAAAEQHDDVAAELTRLRALAARPRQLAALVLAEAAVPALAGIAAGALLAAVVSVAAAGVAGVPARAVLDAGLLTSGNAVLAFALWVAAIAVVAGVLGGGQSRTVRVALEAGCVVALAGLTWQASSRGQLDAAQLAAGGTIDPVLVLAPGAAALACGLLALRLAPSLLRALARGVGREAWSREGAASGDGGAARGGGAARRGGAARGGGAAQRGGAARTRGAARRGARGGRRSGVGVYLSLVGLARQPGRTAAAVAVVAVAAAAGAFALGHARTLQRGAFDQAAYRTAGDVRGLAPAPGARPKLDDTPVVRMRVETLVQPLPVQLLGIGAQALPRLPGWRADFSATPVSELAQRLDGDPGGVRLQGADLPRDAEQLDLEVRVTGAPVQLQLAVQRRDGTFARLLAPSELRPGDHHLAAPVGPSERGGRVVALEINPVLGGTSAGELGEVRPGTLQARGATGGPVDVTDFTGWIPSTDGTFTARVFSYSIAGFAGYLAVRPEQPAAREPIPVLATPGLARQARADGTLRVGLPGGGETRLKVVGRVEHVPTAARGEAAVADVGRLFAALNTEHPGLAEISERWRTGPAPPAHGPELRLDELAADAAADPLARGVLLGLRTLALLGALVALAAVGLAVAATARDRGGEQAELEAIGVPPRTLRAQMVAGAAVIAATGLVAGLLGGAALARGFTGLVALGADGRRPLLELLPAFPWPLAIAAIALAAVAAIVAANAQARRAFRGDALGRLGG